MASSRRGFLPLGIATIIVGVFASPLTSQARGDFPDLSSSLRRVSGNSRTGRLPVPPQETRSRWIEGALIGAAVGGASGALLFNALAPDLCDPDDNQPGSTCEESGLTRGSSIVLGIGLGALVGGLIGNRIRTGFSVGPFGTAAGVIDFDWASGLSGRVTIPWK